MPEPQPASTTQTAYTPGWTPNHPWPIRAKAALELALAICDGVPTRAHLSADPTLQNLGRHTNHGQYQIIRDVLEAAPACPDDPKILRPLQRLRATQGLAAGILLLTSLQSAWQGGPVASTVIPAVVAGWMAGLLFCEELQRRRRPEPQPPGNLTGSR